MSFSKHHNPNKETRNTKDLHVDPGQQLEAVYLLKYLLVEPFLDCHACRKLAGLAP